MSDHPKVAERNLKRIRICNDIYFDVFRLLSPAKLGLELALVSDRFDCLVDMHFTIRKWALGKLTIDSEDIIKTNDDGSQKIFPVDDGSKKWLPFLVGLLLKLIRRFARVDIESENTLPSSIVGFTRVDIQWDWYAESDSVGIPFLRRIAGLLESDVCLGLEVFREPNWKMFTTSVWPLLNVSAIIKLFCAFPSIFGPFRRLTSTTILRDCFNLRILTFDLGLFLKFPPDDSEGSSDGQAICKWLHTPRADGQPKVFRCGCEEFADFSTDALKTAFLSETTSVNFIILFGCSPVRFDPFELVNSMTHERLTSRKIGNAEYDVDVGDGWWLVERSPIDKSADQWAKWEREALENDWYKGKNDWKVLGIRSLD